jgi:enamine deaminase RidA (YjgF/YER057c/UK114 family)
VTTSLSRQSALDSAIHASGHKLDGPILIGGNYVSVVQDGSLAWVSGQIPRVGNTIVATGRVGSDVSLSQAQMATQVCVLRALTLLRQSLGSLDRVAQVLRVNVFVQCAPDFTQQSEVADAASNLLQEVLGDAGRHTRTSLGVYQLPKNAAVEVDMVVRTTAV